MVNARVQHPDHVDVPENGNQSVEKMERRTVISVWQNVSKLHVKTNINVLKVVDTDKKFHKIALISIALEC